VKRDALRATHAERVEYDEDGNKVFVPEELE
jgi:hypothetical protein